MLKLSLKPNERIIIGGAIIRNTDGKAELLIENKVAVLRQKDILSLEAADTPCKRIYFAVQLMYVDEGNLAEHHRTYWKLVRDVIKAAPSTVSLVDRISEAILGNKYYEALKAAKKLIEYETEVIRRYHESAGRIQKS